MGMPLNRPSLLFSTCCILHNLSESKALCPEEAERESTRDTAFYQLDALGVQKLPFLPRIGTIIDHFNMSIFRLPHGQYLTSVEEEECTYEYISTNNYYLLFVSWQHLGAPTEIRVPLCYILHEDIVRGSPHLGEITIYADFWTLFLQPDRMLGPVITAVLNV